MAVSGGSPSFTTITTTSDASISGLTVGKGGGAVSNNTVVGNGALAATSGGQCTAIGNAALAVNTATNNTAVGTQALTANTSGVNNDAFGYATLYTNTTGTYNTAIGGYNATSKSALFSNTSGSYNIAVGNGALQANTTASNNTAVGYQAGYTNSLGTGSTFIGYKAGYTSNQASLTPTYSTFVGLQSGYSVTTGGYNTFIGGVNSGYDMTTGSFNTIIGGYTGNQGGLDIRTSSNYIVLSDGAGNPQFYMAADGVPKSAPTYNNTSASAANMIISGSYSFGRTTSALKYKQDIRDLPSIDINKFRPVVYKSKCENDDQTLDHFGIIADEVDEAGIKELVTYGDNGEVESFQYERLTVVLLKAIQELKAELDTVKAELAALKG
jgi:hypothetical protein